MSPLLQVDSLAAPLIVCSDRRITTAEFVGTVEFLQTRWPDARHVVNLCERRCHFLAAFVVSCLRGQVTLLPPNQTSGTVADLRCRYSDSVAVDDAFIERLLSESIAPSETLPDWRIDPNRVVALAFTSGSTGAPQPHPKTWLTLSRNAQLAAAEVLGGAGTQLVATVPAQHVYGLETTAMTALAAGCSIFDQKPFFAADVRAALEAMATPRTLVTTPTHLKHLIESHSAMPALQHVVSATAPLSLELAERIEHAWNTRVYEIYGCTEAGVMAKRRTVERRPWRTFSGGNVSTSDEISRYEAPQLPAPIPLQDMVEPLSPTEFTLLGRSADMIKVAGKRTSLQALTQQLLDVDGVVDAVVFVPIQDARPVAFAVAPNHTVHSIVSALGEHVDAVFLPRPLILLDKLPRNAVGKLPREALLKILGEHVREAGSADQRRD